jgi:Lon protease-like protein
LKKIKLFFNKINYSVEFNELSKLNFDQLVSTVCMIAPFSSEEKQKLIETIEIEDKVKILEEILNFCLLDIEENRTIQ